MSVYLIVDENRKFELDQKPSEREGFEKSGVKIMDIDSLENGAKYKETDKDVLMPISKGNVEKVENRLIVKNNLYKNCYSPMSNFPEMYYRDMQFQMMRIAQQMGAVSLRFFHREEEKQFFWSRFIGSIFGTMKGNQVSIKGAQESKGKNHCLKEEDMGFTITDDKLKQDMKKTKMSKEELQEWLAEEEINLKAFPEYFAAMIYEYLRVGECYRDYDVKKTMHTLKEVEEWYDVKADLVTNMPSFAAKCKIDVEKKEKQEQEKYQEIIFEIKF